MQNLREKVIDSERNNDILQYKIKELTEKYDKLQKKIKKKEIEYENKIMQIDNNDDKLKKYIERIKYLEQKLKEEENLRKSKEKEIEELKKKLKNAGIKDEGNNDIQKIKEENQKLKSENSKLKEEKAKIENDYNNLKKSKEKKIENIPDNQENNVNNNIKEKEPKQEKNELKNNIVDNFDYNLDDDVDENVEYKVDYYKGNISNLVNSIYDQIPLDKIPDCLKRVFLINDSIYNEEFYFKGIFPKIIISTEAGNENNIKGVCSLYYESNENLGKKSILRLSTIYATGSCERQIIKMIDFIKNNIIFESMEVYLLYDKKGNKYIPNQRMKDIFQKKLGFKWLCVVKEEKLQQRYIKLYYTKEDVSQQEENVENNNNNKNNKNFKMDTMTIITVNNKDNTSLLGNLISAYRESTSFKCYYNKFLNPNPIYYLLLENKSINDQYTQAEKQSEVQGMKDNFWRYVNSDIGWNILEEEKKKITELDFDISDSLYKQIEDYYNTNNVQCLCDLYKNNLSINFENNYSILIDDIYYNRISTTKIKILKEKKTDSLFFLIPSNDNTVLFYISIANRKIKKLLLDSNKNVYEKFLEFQPSTQKEIIDFSNSSVRDFTQIPQCIKSDSKTIYIPSFSFSTHLFTHCFKDITKNVSISNNETKEPLYLTSVDEYLNVVFHPDDNIGNSFSVVPVEDKKSNIIIRESFIIGIFDNNIINKDKLPLLQFLYVDQEHFLTKDNYNPKYI